ncbi:MAG TPA: tetratricopeptide repeat protein [Rhizomicrobium sp.]|jgi:predicted TPR repeat methyltransferase
MNRRQRRAQGKADRPAISGSRTAVPDPIALHESGIQAYRTGNPGQAAALIAKAIAFNGVVPSFHYNLGIVLKALGRLEEASASYERAIALKSDYVDAHNNLGNVLKALGRQDQARASFERALQYNPGNADTHYSLGMLCCDLGLRDEAETHFRDCLARDPDDSKGLRILLAHLGVGDAPERASEAQLLGIYEVRSRFWDQEHGYFGAGLVAEAFRRHVAGAMPAVLDIGCGTGRAGEKVRDLSGRLDGVDVSPAMLEKAKAKGVYDQLFQADLVAFMAGHRDSYDGILAAATLIHFGALEMLFRSASTCLRDGGLFVFTFFPTEEMQADYAVAANARLAQSGCFQHGVSYVERIAVENGFAVLQLETVVHEHDQEGNKISGCLVVLRRQPR